jgi:hypothetical protein
MHFEKKDEFLVKENNFDMNNVFLYFMLSGFRTLLTLKNEEIPVYNSHSNSLGIKRIFKRKAI